MSISNIKILLLNVNRSGWHSGNMIYDMEAVNQACDVKFYGPGFEGYKNTDIIKIINQLYGSDKPDIIYSYFTPNERVRDVYMSHYKIDESLRLFPQNLEKTNIVKIFALSDFWARSSFQYSKDLSGNVFNYCFSCFAPPYSSEKHFYSFFDDNIRKNIKFIGYPRCVDKNCFKDYNQSKKYDVITVGAMGHFYPLRTFMHSVLQKINSQVNINYKNYCHCGSDFSHSDFVRDKYAKAINESKMLLSCGGRYSLAFNKIFEAMGCCTAYVGERPYGEEELHLKSDYNYIAVDKLNFIQRIKEYLEDKDKLTQIITNANKTFLEYHTIEKRASDFVELVKIL